MSETTTLVNNNNTTTENKKHTHRHISPPTRFTVSSYIHSSTKIHVTMRILTLLLIIVAYTTGGHCEDTTENTCNDRACYDEEDLMVTVEDRLERMKSYVRKTLDDASEFEKRWEACAEMTGSCDIDALCKESSLTSAALAVRGLYASWSTKKYSWILKSVSKIVSRRAGYGSWKAEQPRTMGALLQSKAALFLGDVNKAKRALSSSLQYDPESKVLKEEFSKLKTYTQKIKKADKSLSKGFYKRTEGELDDAQTEMYRLGLEDSKLLLADLHVRYCKCFTYMKKHERAIESCDKAMKLSEDSVEEIKGLGIDARRRIDILEARAIAHDKDRNYDEAVSDIRAAIELTSKLGVSRDKVQALETKLREAQEAESKWNRLRDRDHVAVLDLPENIDEVKDMKRKCQWLKKAYRKMTVKWHPDRTKETNNQKRAGRKFDEINKAYEVLQAQWGCKGGRVATPAQRQEMRKELEEMFSKEQGGGPPRGGGGGGFPFNFGGGGGGFPGGGFPGGRGGAGGRQRRGRRGGGGGRNRGRPSGGRRRHHR